MTSPATGHIAGHILRGSAWMVLMRWMMRGIGLVNTIVLARILSPDDFGIIAMSVLIVEFLMMLGDTNVDIALIRDPKAARAVYDSAWTFQAICGFSVAILVVAAAPLLAAYYRDPRVEMVMYIVALRPAILGLENVGVVEFRKSLNFAKEFRYWIFRRLSLVIISLVLALTLRNYLALAISAPISALIAVIFSFIMSPYRPRPTLVAVALVWGASRWMILQNLAQVALDRVDEFIIGGVSTSTAVGNYYIAAQVAPMPTRELAWPVERALMPAYAKITDDGQALSRTAVTVMGMMGLICFPLGAGMLVVADDLVHTVFGDTWSATVPFFRWLAIFGIFAGLGRPLMPLFYALHRERFYAGLCVLQVAITVPALLIAIQFYGLVAVAMARTAVAAVFFIVFCIAATRLVDVRLSQFLAVLWRPACAAALMALSVSALHDSTISLPFLSLIRDTALGIIVFIFIQATLWLLAGRPEGPEKTAAARIREFLGRGLPAKS